MSGALGAPGPKLPTAPPHAAAPARVPSAPPLSSVATIDRFVSCAKAAGMDGALIVHHNFAWNRADVILGTDHEYVHAALQRHPGFFRAMGIVDPAAGPKMALAALETLHGLGFSGVRLSGPQFAQVDGGLGGEVGRALFARAGELGMPVGVMAFGGVADALPGLRSLLGASGATKLIIDHFGFCRQAGAAQRRSVDALLELARCAPPQADGPGCAPRPASPVCAPVGRPF